MVESLKPLWSKVRQGAGSNAPPKDTAGNFSPFGARFVPTMPQRWQACAAVCPQPHTSFACHGVSPWPHIRMGKRLMWLPLPTFTLHGSPSTAACKALVHECSWALLSQLRATAQKTNRVIRYERVHLRIRAELGSSLDPCCMATATSLCVQRTFSI